MFFSSFFAIISDEIFKLSVNLRFPY